MLKFYKQLMRLLSSVEMHEINFKLKRRSLFSGLISIWTGSGENIRSARSSRVVLSKILVARKANVYLCSCSKKVAVLARSRMFEKTISYPY